MVQSVRYLIIRARPLIDFPLLILGKSCAELSVQTSGPRTIERERRLPTLDVLLDAAGRGELIEAGKRRHVRGS